ncbi:nif-specific transcriptional activator NifA [Nitrincola alkalisediminis]|uniref:nif-specific transcriptional activator NifA n=1 Tax=Nitrincola alkalisediminis TaxID=1366656 RepID=UPI001CA981F8|nr:nif-specific transcriptional activator NifA [Nitrincola alkalisediminis]
MNKSPASLYDDNDDRLSPEMLQAILVGELETLFLVSQVLSKSLNLQETLSKVMEVLDDRVGLERGLVGLVSPEQGELVIYALCGVPDLAPGDIRYQPGEGVVGEVMRRGSSLILNRITDDPRFLGRLGVYDPQRPFIGVPILSGDEVLGVFAAQPSSAHKELLEERARFLEMVANLIGQSVRLSREVERERKALRDERDALKCTVRGQFGFDNIIGHSFPMRQVFEQVRQVAKWNTTVLIRGETGTGKELIANAIHYNSPRARGPFVKLNCAALPENLLESELFGHEKGAFTGAVSQRQGRFEQADKGTLFLDEIGEVSAGFQAKLLRVLQEGELERVGGTRTIKINVRVVAATHRDLEADVEQGLFREDLYYRLNVMPIFMPTLRERLEDIPDIANFLLTKIATAQERSLSITDNALRVLMHHRWPGNVRELENCLERAAVMSHDGIIDRDQVLLTGIDEQVMGSHGGRIDLDDDNLDERERVIAALEQAGWVQAKAARLLGMTPRQISYRIQTLNIRVKQL